MKLNKVFFGGLALAALSASAGAVPVTLSTVQTTVNGQSIFVTAELPELGALSMAKALKMEPSDYPTWRITVDLPPGATITPRYYKRLDAPLALSNTTNGTLMETGATITVPATGEGPWMPQRFHVYADASAVTFSFTDSPAPLKAAGNPKALGWLTGDVPAPDVIAKRTVRLQAGAALFPASRGVLLNRRESWWRHGQGFLYLPGETAPSAPRGETFSFTPTGFRSRTIRVHLPRGYTEQTARRYPVIYAVDGQNLRSYDTGLQRFGSWDLDLTMNDLTAHGEMPEAILIGVDNTADRFAEYMPNWASYQSIQGRGTDFLARLRDELMPQVNSRYRTLTGPENSVLVGSSLGGLLGLEAAHEFEATWGATIAMSPSTQIGIVTIETLAARAPSTRGRLWIDSGNSGTSNDNCTLTLLVRDTFLENGAAVGRHFFHTVGHGDQHNEAAWKRRSPAALRWAFSLAPEPPLQDGWKVQ